MGWMHGRPIIKRIMIIGANWEQEPLLKKAKEMGLYIIATNPYPGAEGFKYSDEDYIVNPRDLQRLDEIFKKTLPGAVIADECDYSMFAVAYLTNKYKLPGPKMDSLMITNNKYLERKFAERANILQPKYKLCMTFEEVVKASDEIGLPVMLKPVDNRGAIGVKRVNSVSELKTTFYDTLPQTHARQILVEEYIGGDRQVSVEGLYVGKFCNLTFSCKQKYPSASVDKHLEFPGKLPENLLRKLYMINEKLVKTIGIDYGLTHTEFIVKDEQPYLLEVHNRGCGINVSNKLIPAITGIDVPQVLISSALGEKVSIDDFLKKRRFGILHFFDFGRGKVLRIENTDTVKNMDGVLTLWINFKVGDYLKNIETGPSRHGCIIVVGDTIIKCYSTIKKIENIIKIDFMEDGGNG